MATVDDAERVSSLAVVIPAFDESESLRLLLPRMIERLRCDDGLRWTILVIVRRGCPPEERSEIAALGAVPVVRGPSDSFGDAIRSGLGAVDPSFSHILVMDADGSHDPDTIPRLLAAAPGADVVIASRYVPGGRSDNGPVLRAMSRALNLCFRVVLGIACADASTNFKLYRRDQVQGITLKCDKFDIVEEILFRLQDSAGPRHLRIVEVPDYFRERQAGVSKRQLGPFVAAYLVTLARLRLSTAKGRRAAHEP